MTLSSNYVISFLCFSFAGCVCVIFIYRIFCRQNRHRHFSFHLYEFVFSFIFVRHRGRPSFVESGTTAAHRQRNGSFRKQNKVLWKFTKISNMSWHASPKHKSIFEIVAILGIQKKSATQMCAFFLSVCRLPTSLTKSIHAHIN